MTVDYPIEERKMVLDVNVNGLFYCRFVARSMEARGYGCIVNIASIAGKEGNPTASAYSAPKAAVIGLTKSLGKELAKSGVCVNAITPATIETPMLAQVSQAHIDYMRSKIPMETIRQRRRGRSADVLAGKPRVLVQHGRGIRYSVGRATY
jgi:NAD(P)-dependent dehydrogenase (short-subunit alcohol dehydrogenase family)